MTRKIQKGSLNLSVELYIVDDTNGTPELGVLFDTAGIDLNYRRDLAAVVSITEATLSSLTASHADGGFLEIANGRYRFDVPDAAFADGVSQVTIGGTVTGMVVLPLTIQLVNFNPNDGTRLGLTALPAAAADAAGGLSISDAGGLDLDAKLANTNEITAARMGALTDWINGGRLDLLLDAIPTTAMRGTDSSALATVCTEGRLAELDGANLPADVDTLLGRITSALFTGITSLSEWLGLLAGKQVGDATARTEVRATGAGSGTFNETLESLEAIRDRGDVAWITAPNDLDAAGIRAAIGLASANLDTQLADIPTVAELNARTLVAASYFDPAADTVANVTTVGSVTTKTGYALLATGLDLVLIDGKTLPVATEIIAAATAGEISGAGTGTETVKGIDAATTRITAAVDGSGNRTAMVYP